MANGNLPARSLDILVADHHEAFALSLAETLALDEHRVRVVSCSASALEIAASDHPDVIFLDLELPGMNGNEMASRLRATPGLERTLLIGASAWDASATEGSTNGAFDHRLQKPFRYEALASILEGTKREGRATDRQRARGSEGASGRAT